MNKQITPNHYGKPEERAAYGLIHYFKVAIGEDVFRACSGDMEAEICGIIEDILEATIDKAKGEADHE